VTQAGFPKVADEVHTVQAVARHAYGRLALAGVPSMFCLSNDRHFSGRSVEFVVDIFLVGLVRCCSPFTVEWYSAMRCSRKR
jgi:hypothetical protein